MKKEDIKAGDVIWHNQGGYGWLFRVTKMDLGAGRFHYTSFMRKSSPKDDDYGYFYMAGGSSWDITQYPIPDLRLGSFEEITWLEACEKENRFVPRPKSSIIDNYTLI